MINDPDPDETDPKKYKDFFEHTCGFGDGSVFMVTLCFGNGELIKHFKKRTYLENEVRPTIAYPAPRPIVSHVVAWSPH